MKLFIKLILDVIIIVIAIMIGTVFLMIMYTAENKCEDLHNVADCHLSYVPVEIEKE